MTCPREGTQPLWRTVRCLIGGQTFERAAERRRGVLTIQTGHPQAVILASADDVGATNIQKIHDRRRSTAVSNEGARASKIGSIARPTFQVATRFNILQCSVSRKLLGNTSMRLARPRRGGAGAEVIVEAQQHTCLRREEVAPIYKGGFLRPGPCRSPAAARAHTRRGHLPGSMRSARQCSLL